MLNTWKWAEHPSADLTPLLHPAMLPAAPKPWHHPSSPAAAGDAQLLHGAGTGQFR